MACWIEGRLASQPSRSSREKLADDNVVFAIAPADANIAKDDIKARAIPLVTVPRRTGALPYWFKTAFNCVSQTADQFKITKKCIPF